MTRMTADAWRALTTDIFKAMGLSTRDATWIGTCLTRADAMARASHGLMRIPQYYEATLTGEVSLKTEPIVTRVAPATALIDAQLNFGQPVARDGMELAIELAREHGIGNVGIYNCTHTGRVGDYPEIAARSGMVGLAFVNGRRGGVVAPWGGQEGRLAPNTFAFACPGGGAAPISVDFSAAAMPEGRVRMLHMLGGQTPPDTLIDSAGRTTTDPQVLYDDPLGAILAFGGPSGGHKGFGLLLTIDILAGILARAGNPKPDLPGNGVLLVAMDISKFMPIDKFSEDMQQLTERLHSSKPLSKDVPVVMPGAQSHRAEKHAEQNGITVDDTIWKQIIITAQKLGIDANSYGGIPRPSGR